MVLHSIIHCRKISYNLIWSFRKILVKFPSWFPWIFLNNASLSLNRLLIFREGCRCWVTYLGKIKPVSFSSSNVLTWLNPLILILNFLIWADTANIIICSKMQHLYLYFYIFNILLTFSVKHIKGPYMFDQFGQFGTCLGLQLWSTTDAGSS